MKDKEKKDNKKNLSMGPGGNAGEIFIAARKIQGKGKIIADGGDGSIGGKGGKVTLVSEDSRFKGEISAKGGKSYDKFIRRNKFSLMASFAVLAVVVGIIVPYLTIRPHLVVKSERFEDKDYYITTKDFPEKIGLGALLSLSNTGQSAACDINIPSNIIHIENPRAYNIKEFSSNMPPVKDLEPDEKIYVRLKAESLKKNGDLLDELLSDLENGKIALLVKATISYRGCNFYQKLSNKIFGDYTTTIDYKISKRDSVILAP